VICVGARIGIDNDDIERCVAAMLSDGAGCLDEKKST
jgi:hypothetical protein